MTPQPRQPPSARPTTLIVGLGRTGWSCARYLHAQAVPFAVGDTRGTPPHAAARPQVAPGVELGWGVFAATLPAGIEQVVVSPGVSLQEPFLQEAAARGV